MKLNPKQRRFVELYLESFNAADACRRAGYAASSARSTGSRLLHTPEIRKLIDAAMDKRAAEYEVTSARILKELHFASTARIDWFELDQDGNVTTRPGVPREALGAVASVKRRTTLDFDGKAREQSTTITLLDKTKALSLAMRYLGLLKDRLEIDFDERMRKVLDATGDDFNRKIRDIAARLREKPEPPASATVN